MLIYQIDNGGGNSGKFPSGGMIWQSSAASSMSSAVVANPITFYDGGGLVINQAGQSNDLYNYYWTSYSRGTDGNGSTKLWHNLYLDSYIPLRHKSIYDPCPYGYRISSNGTYNEFTNTGWTSDSYCAGATWRQSWFLALGWRNITFEHLSNYGFYSMATPVSNTSAYFIGFLINVKFVNGYGWSRQYGSSVRCIEECELLPDATEAKEQLIIEVRRKFQNT